MTVSCFFFCKKKLRMILETDPSVIVGKVAVHDAETGGQLMSEQVMELCLFKV